MKRHGHTAIPYPQRMNSSRSSPANEASPVQTRFDFDQMTAPRTAANATAGDNPESRFAIRFAALLEADPTAAFNNVAVSTLAREIFGSSAGYARDAYDAAEAGFNIYVNRIGLDFRDVPAAIDKLLAGQKRLPLQTRRDQAQIDFQQFSTPHAEGLVVVKAAAMCSGMTVLEPSAGTGNIAALARLTGAQVDTNEIDPRRRNLLSLQGFEPTAFDAERLDNLLPADKTYHAIVMNPPFSATGGRVNGHRTAFGARHIEQALLRLKPGGRLVAIVGRGMAMERPAFRDWWEAIGQKYQVRANVGIDGSQYSRFGTTFDNQIIVIDREPPQAKDSAIITGNGLSFHAAFELLKNLSEEDVYGRVCEHDPEASDSGTARYVSVGNHGGNGSARGVDRIPPGGRSRGRFVANGHSDHDGPMADLEPVGDGPARRFGSDDNQRTGTGANGPAGGNGSDAELGGLFAAEHARPDGNAVGQLDTSATPQVVDIEEGTVFAAYRVQKAIVRGAHPHPANVVESTAMACVEPPDVTYRHHLPSDVIAEGWVSNLQIEDVIYAGQATSVILPDGSRKGHWNGDGTGIGKGREIYAFIYNELQQGRRRHVHISASNQLCDDAKRDRDAVGLPLEIIHQAQYKPKEAIPGTAGVFFTTYTMLSIDFAGERQRFKQLIDWLGPDFDGVIAFDEAHLMKNAAATPHGGKATVDHGTLRGNMGITLERLFPQARVRYFSATGATEARHMAPYERLGLWGAGRRSQIFRRFS